MTEIEQLQQQLSAAKATIEKFQNESICVYCQQGFHYRTREEQDALVNHIMTCEKNPLVNLINELGGKLTTTQKALREARERIESYNRFIAMSDAFGIDSSQRLNDKALALIDEALPKEGE